MICIGQSHLACVLLAADEAGISLEAIALKDAYIFDGVKQSAFEIDRTGRRLAPETAKRLSESSPIFSFVGGIAHMSLGIWRHPQPFDFVLPEAPDLPLEPEAEIVPSGAMRAVLKQRSERHLRTLTRIVKLAGGTVYQFESPPPPADRRMLERTAARIRRVGATFLSDNGGRAEPAGKYLRYKLWRLNSQIAREHMEVVGARFVEHPAEAVDEEGFLRREFCRNATHANSAYGAFILEQMQRLQ